jgi:hypothetical protein
MAGHSRHYRQTLLVKSRERRNAENLSRLVPVSAWALQRFLTEDCGGDAAVIARLQEYLGPQLAHHWRCGSWTVAISPNRGSSPWE